MTNLIEIIQFAIDNQDKVVELVEKDAEPTQVADLDEPTAEALERARNMLLGIRAKANEEIERLKAND